MQSRWALQEQHRHAGRGAEAAVGDAAAFVRALELPEVLKGLSKGARKRVEGELQTIQIALRDKVLGILEGVANNKQREWVMNQIGENRPGLNERYEELAGTADSEAVNALLTRVDTWAGWLRDRLTRQLRGGDGLRCRRACRAFTSPRSMPRCKGRLRLAP